MSEDIRKKWNLRFANKKCVAPNPPPFVEFMQPLLKPGSLLDIACGDGALALYFAKNNWQVTGWDISEIALQRLESFANDEGINLHTCCCDLEHMEQTKGTTQKQYNNIVIGRYKPNNNQWRSIISMLNHGGILCISTFNELQYQEHGFSKRFCLEKDELQSLKNLTLIKQQRVIYGGDHFDNYCFQKQPA